MRRYQSILTTYNMHNKVTEFILLNVTEFILLNLTEFILLNVTEFILLNVTEFLLLTLSAQWLQKVADGCIRCQHMVVA